MAEQVRLKRGGLALRVPQVEFAASKVEAQGFANLARSLDSMTNYFLRQAEQKAQIQGAEYGALNAPTEQQIRDAYDRGEEIEIPGNQNSVFGRAARKAALSIASDEVSALASKELANVEGIFNTILDSPSMPEEEKQRLAEQLGIEDFSPQSLVTVMDTVIAGYGKTLDDTSPALARRFRAEQSITANGKWTKYLDAYVKQENQKLESSFRVAHTENYSESKISSALELPNGLKIIKKNREDEIKKASSFLVGAEMNTFLDGMVATNEAAALQVLTDKTFAGPSPVKIIKKVQQNQLADLDVGIQNSVKLLKAGGMSNSDIAQELRKRRTDQLEFLENEQQGMNDNAEKDEAKIKASVMEHMASGNTEAFNNSISILKITDPVKAQEFVDEFVKAGGRRTQSDPDVVTALTKLGSNITFSDVENNFKKLSNADLEKFRKDAATFESQEMKTALAVVKGDFLDLPEEYSELVKDKPEIFAKSQLLNKITGRLKARYDEAQDKGLAFNGQEIANELLEELGGDFTEAIKKMAIRSGEQVISRLNELQDNQVFTEQDFTGALTYYQQLLQNTDQIPPKMRRAKGQAPRNFIQSQIKSLTEAKEAANRI